MQLIERGSRYDYLIDEYGTIYRKSGKGIKPIEKRLGSRGYLEFKMSNKTVQYHQIVAKMLLPNPKGCNMVFFRSKDYFDVRPENLCWVWSRQGQTLTRQQAIQRSNDRDLIVYYKTGNESVLSSIIQRELTGVNIEYLGAVYEILYNYAKRCLLFNMKNDTKQVYFGLVRQSKRKRIKTVQLNERFN